MSKVDWSKAPEGAEFYSSGCFYKCVNGVNRFSFGDPCWFESGFQSREALMQNEDYEPRPQQWPSESRIDIIGTNGNTGEAYVHYDEFRETGKPPEAKPAKNKYQRDIVGLDGTKTTVDVYRVLDAFKTESAAIDHAVKKLLAPGLRHSKDRKQDLKEAIDSIAAELLLMEQK